MFIKRTDLALEARELWQESAERTSRLSGVKATKTKLEGYPLTRVDILNEKGEAALGKPQGSYLTIDLTTFWPFVLSSPGLRLIMIIWLVEIVIVSLSITSAFYRQLVILHEKTMKLEESSIHDIEIKK